MMNKNIKPIETVYNGYRFRSRLEARWAVFFRAVGLDYQYEPEGFEMDGIRYLPDFYLPSIDRWFEIKGKPLSVEEIKKCEEFCLRKDNYGIKFSIAIGPPQPVALQFEESGYEACFGIEEYAWQWPSARFPEEYRIHEDKLVEEEYYSRFGLGIWVVPETDQSKVLEACRLAREARFEYGEKPKV